MIDRRWKYVSDDTLMFGDMIPSHEAKLIISKKYENFISPI